MSTAPVENSTPDRIIDRFVLHISSFYRSNIVGVTDNRGNTSTITETTTNETTWMNTFYQLDRELSGGSLHLLFHIIDITLLLIGLFSNHSDFSISSNLVITSICLLIFYFIDLSIILLLSVRNILLRGSQLTEQQKLEQLRRATLIRGSFTIFKIIPICFGTSYAFSSNLKSSDSELIRVCLGIVCLSTWLTILIPVNKPELPLRRSLIIEGFIVLFVVTINCTYIGTIAHAINNVNYTTCIYINITDLYLGSPLKSYAYVGLVLFACTTTIHLVNTVISQLYFRFSRYRRLYIRYYAFQYALNYFSTIVVIYYFAIGGLLLFQPRSGQPCRDSAPILYRILLIWEWIRILAPMIAVPLVTILCCLGVCFGVILSFCLPASITVPLLDLLQVSIRHSVDLLLFQ